MVVLTCWHGFTLALVPVTLSQSCDPPLPLAPWQQLRHNRVTVRCSVTVLNPTNQHAAAQICNRGNSQRKRTGILDGG